jgi:hypothetical protein
MTSTTDNIPFNVQQSRACLPIVHWHRIISIDVSKTTGDRETQITISWGKRNLCLSNTLNRCRIITSVARSML